MRDAQADEVRRDRMRGSPGLRWTMRSLGGSRLFIPRSRRKCSLHQDTWIMNRSCRVSFSHLTNGDRKPPAAVALRPSSPFREEAHHHRITASSLLPPSAQILTKQHRNTVLELVRQTNVPLRPVGWVPLSFMAILLQLFLMISTQSSILREVHPE